MSKVQAKALLERLAADDEFRRRLEAAPHEEKRGILEAEGYGDVRLAHISAVIPESAGGDLTEDEIAAISGGANAVGAGVGTAAGLFVVGVASAAVG